MKLICFFILIVCSSFQIKQTENLFSTKTAYLDSFTPEQLEFINITQNYQLEECVPELVYLVLRHGSRYPSLKQVEKASKFLASVKEANVDSHVLNGIKQTFDPEQHYKLSDLGAFEMKQIAKRFKSRYPHLFSNPSQIDLISSSKERSIHSAEHFLAQLFGNNTFNDKVLINDQMMRLFDECSNYLNHVKRNQSTYEQMSLFANSSHFKNLLNNFKQRHQLESLEFEPKLLIKLFTLCNIESAHKMNENWCKLFVEEDFEILSYLTDLKQYWLKSYGNEMNAKMVFPIIKDLFEKIDSFLNNELKERVFLRFGHAENIFPLVTALGLFKDAKELNASNFNLNLKRKFKSAQLSPFSSNIAFVLNKCGNNNNEYKIALFVNELPLSQLNAGNLLCAVNNSKLVRLSESFCELNDFRNQLKNYLLYEFDNVCYTKQFKTEL